MKKTILLIVCVASFILAGPLPTFEDIGSLESMGADPYGGMQLCFPYITLTDWDGDGKNDVIMAGVLYPSLGGYVYLFKNSSPTAGAYTKFEKGVQMQAGGGVISVASN